MSDYTTFLASKRIVAQPAGFEVAAEQLPAGLFPFQSDITRWALRKGRAAVFAGTGLGKTAIQLAWADAVHRHTGDDVLILAPLAVAPQTVREGEKFGIAVRHCRDGAEVQPGITITNYDRLHRFDPARFGAIVIDESSILKSYTGATRTAIIEAFAETPYRLACTATPAPNDFMELGNHAEFLGVMSRVEMMAMFFVHDGGSTQDWRLKGHAEAEFWRWVCSWAVVLRRPSDLGYEDGGFALPPLQMHSHTVESAAPPGALFAMEALTLHEQRAARKASIKDRVEKVVEIIHTQDMRYNLRHEQTTNGSTTSTRSGLVCEEPRASKRRAEATSGTPDTGGESGEERIHASLSSGEPGQVEADAGATGEGQRSPSRVVRTGRGSTGQSTSISEGVAAGQSGEAEGSASRGIRDRHQRLSGSVSGSAGSVRDLRVLRSEQAEDVSDRGSRSRNGEGAGTALRELQPRPGEVQGRREYHLRGSGLPDSDHAYEPWVIWCDFDNEQRALERAFKGHAISIYGSLTSDEKEQRLLAWLDGQRPILICKPSIAGHGINMQMCANVAFVGVSHSWEQYYQAIRRCWRFGQTRPVQCHVISSTAEGAVVANLERKEREAERMASEMVNQMQDLNRADLLATAREVDDYAPRTTEGRGWTLHRGDCVEVLRGIPDATIDYSIFSPPFASLYTYSNSPRDMGNCKTHAEFYEHFTYCVQELYRVLKPGRLLSFHCMNLPTSKVRDGVIGISDFRGDLIRMFQAAGFVYHSEVVIWKDPVTAMQRTKALGLLHKQLVKDASMSRQGIPDYLVTMRKPGENSHPVSGILTTFVGEESGEAFEAWCREQWRNRQSLPGVSRRMTYEDFRSVMIWQRYASPVWMDINPSDTLQASSARDERDEKHIAPLQLEVIRRAVQLWTNPDDLVLSPFAGIGSEGVVSLREGRRFVGVELKASYERQAIANLKRAEQESQQRDLFSYAAAQEATS